MPSISNQSRELQASAIRKLSPYSDAAEANGVNVYHLNIGAPDIKSPASAFDYIRRSTADHLPYSHSAGTHKLRNAVVQKYYQRIGIDINIDEMMVTVAGSEALSFALQVCCDPGDEVIVIEPFYTNYYSFAFASGIAFKAVHTDIRDGFKVPGIEAFEAICTPRTKALLICTPSNPTGTLYSREDMLLLGEFCRKHDLFLISDEVYREFCYTDEPHFSAMNIPGLEQNVILVDSFSKRYNLCGARIGCMISHNTEVIATAMKYAQARLCPPIFGQMAVIGSLDAPESYFAQTRNEYIARRDCLLELLNQMEGVYSPMPLGAFYTLAELPVDDAEKFAQWLLTDWRVDGETVMLTPAESFYLTPGCGRNQVRIAYVLEIPHIRKAMQILEAGLKAYPGRTI